MEEILHHLGCIKPYEWMGYLPYQLISRISEPSTVSRFQMYLYPSLNHQEILGIILSNRGVEGPHRDLHMISTLNLCGKTRQVILEQNMVDFFFGIFPMLSSLVSTSVLQAQHYPLFIYQGFNKVTPSKMET